MGLEREKIERINELARLSRERALTQEELAQRDALRKEYIAGFRQNMQQVLDNVRIKQPGRHPRAVAKETGQALNACPNTPIIA